VSRFVDLQAGEIEINPAVLPRAYFPKTVSDVRDNQTFKKALETLDPAAGSVVLNPHAPIRQDPRAIASLDSYDEQSYRVRYQVASPSLLKLTEAWFPGWRAFLGDHEIPIVRVDYALMGAVVPAGGGEIRFEFRSNYFRYGLAITGVTLLLISFIAFSGVFRRRPGPRLTDG
jgi:uncharacterized membrane protein YfhO